MSTRPQDPSRGWVQDRTTDTETETTSVARSEMMTGLFGSRLNQRFEARINTGDWRPGFVTPSGLPPAQQGGSSCRYATESEGNRVSQRAYRER
jgi:hypothetical protein